MIAGLPSLSPTLVSGLSVHMLGGDMSTVSLFEVDRNVLFLLRVRSTRVCCASSNQQNGVFNIMRHQAYMNAPNGRLLGVFDFRCVVVYLSLNAGFLRRVVFVCILIRPSDTIQVVGHDCNLCTAGKDVSTGVTMEKTDACRTFGRTTKHRWWLSLGLRLQVKYEMIRRPFCG